MLNGKLSTLGVIAGVVGSYLTVFQSHVGTDVKTAVAPAALALIGWWHREEKATARNETTASASLGKAPATPSVAAITDHVMRQLGVTPGQVPPAGPSTS